MNHKRARKLISTKLIDDDFTSTYLYGKLCNKSKRYSESAEYFKRSIILNNSHSMYEYAELLRKKRYEPIPSEDFVQYYKKSIELGNTQGDAKISTKLEEGAKYVKIASDNGFIDEIAWYRNGVEVNPEEAIKYYKFGIEKGSSFAMNEYGYMLMYGLGVEVDYKEAIKYYKMATDKGNYYAMAHYS